jgi:poly(3-hydroxybutyrate) depolymerase
VLLLLLQVDLLVERALAEDDRERRRAGVEQLRKLDFAAVEKAVRSPSFGPPKLEPGRIVERPGYALHVPAAYDPETAWPLLVTLHGFNPSGDAPAVPNWIQAWLRCAGARERLILVAPTTTRHTRRATRSRR